MLFWLNADLALQSKPFAAALDPAYIAPDDESVAFASDALVKSVAEAVVCAILGPDPSPTNLSTLKQIASALGDDPAFAVTVASNLSGAISALHDELSSDLSDAIGGEVTARSDADDAIVDAVDGRLDALDGRLDALESAPSLLSARLTNDFSKTDTSFSDTALNLTLAAGKTYQFEAMLFCSHASDGHGGAKAALAGTATFTKLYQSGMDLTGGTPHARLQFRRRIG